jgi:hypothetical protein
MELNNDGLRLKGVTLSETKAAPHPDTVKALGHVERLAEKGYWGSVTVKLQAGRATQIVIEESMIPSQLEDPKKTNAVRSTK